VPAARTVNVPMILAGRVDGSPRSGIGAPIGQQNAPRRGDAR
jgi:hypothetical protein